LTPSVPGRARGSLSQWLEQTVVITVVDPDAARAALSAGTLCCPQSGCEGRLRVWSKARARAVLMGGGRRVQVRPDRARCRDCGVTQVLLPAWCLPRRAYGVEVVGAALRAAAEGDGYRCVAARIAVPVSTVRGWVRAVARGAAELSAAAVSVTRALGADTGPCWISGPTPAGPLRAALQALGSAASALTRRAGAVPRTSSGALSGIDYLALLAERHREELYRRLRLADPTDAAGTAPPWHQVTMITGGRLLTSTPSG
jgi:hypothetical protein